MSTTRTHLVLAILAVLAIALVGCASPPATSPVTTAAIAGIATPAPTADRPGIDTPPDAELMVEGGDPVAGQLGTFVWGGGGSDSPWLPGTPVRAAAGEILSITLAPDVVLSGWSALLAPAANGGGEGAIKVGTGPAAMDVVAPEAGSWTLAVTIEFGDLGGATYFWRLEVS